MSNLKHLSREQLLTEKHECKRQMNAAFAKLSGQKTRLQWINKYLYDRLNYLYYYGDSCKEMLDILFKKRWNFTDYWEERTIRCSFDGQKRFFMGESHSTSMPGVSDEDIHYLLNTSSVARVSLNNKEKWELCVLGMEYEKAPEGTHASPKEHERSEHIRTLQSGLRVLVRKSIVMKGNV